ncbi:MAG: LPS export ABC transporter ATP-binding protein [Acidobacteria bacterium]|nr:LPS export ABC transporter ATP-binding protein [Acidobacteriota bacterium]MCW5950578.1 LPS export ABC transporter ATP-binding protein [Pyrinomonadaceae bacterium]
MPDSTSPQTPAVADEIFLAGRSLTKTYTGRRVVDGVDIEIRTGEVVGLLGANGAGKTTTFYMLVGLEDTESGSVVLNGRDVTRLPMYLRARLGLGYLPQEASIFRKLTAEQNILAVLETLPLTREQRMDRLEELLAEFGIEHSRKVRGDALSGGERRRCEIARCLATAPQFILLDEPFAGIDPLAIEDIRDLILYLKRSGIGVLITDHNVRETLSITDRAYILSEGKTLRSGTPDDLVNDPDVRRLYLGDRFTL